eukprot:1548675-Lingulodinium_polyedra.AAC.1
MELLSVANQVMKSLNRTGAWNAKIPEFLKSLVQKAHDGVVDIMHQRVDVGSAVAPALSAAA